MILSAESFIAVHIHSHCRVHFLFSKQNISGSVVFDRMDGFEFNYYKSNFKDTDPFMMAWKEQGKDQVRRLNKLVPLSWLNANPDYYQVRAALSLFK